MESSHPPFPFDQQSLVALNFLRSLRHTFASVLASSGSSLLVIGRVLGDTVPATTARYAHLADDPVREAAETAGARLAAAMRGEEGTNVGPLH